MYTAFRPAARRLISIRSNVSLLAAPKSRSITTQSIAFRSRAVVSTPLRIRQRRWNSDEANKNTVAEKVEVEIETKVSTDAVAESEAAIAESAINSVAEGAPIATTTTTTGSETDTATADAIDSLQSEGSELRNSLFDNAPTTHRGPRNPSKERVLRLDGSNLIPKETLYVANLFFDVTAQDLKARFQPYGVVTECHIIHDSRGLSKGFGYVTFETVEQATRAVEELNQTVYEGRRILVQYSAAAPRQRGSRHQKEPTRTLYVGNLAYDMSDRELNELFKSVRNIVEVRVAVDRQTGAPRGFAHADFIDVASAQAAREILASKAPHGRRLRVDFSERAKQRSVAQAINDEVREEKGEEELEK